jgi:hypothetical protein
MVVSLVEKKPSASVCGRTESVATETEKERLIAYAELLRLDDRHFQQVLNRLDLPPADKPQFSCYHGKREAPLVQYCVKHGVFAQLRQALASGRE